MMSAHDFRLRYTDSDLHAGLDGNDHAFLEMTTLRIGWSMTCLRIVNRNMEVCRIQRGCLEWVNAEPYERAFEEPS
jgi:hypothetical protein